MSAPLGVGIIGCGNISTTYFDLAPMFRGIEVRACADLMEKAARRQAEAYGIRASSIDGLLAADDIELVVNLTVPDAHFDVTAAALDAGKHVYSEKPLALSVADGLKLKSLADRKGLGVGCAPDTILGGAHQLARKLIDDGTIGTVTAGTAHVMSHGMEHWHPNPDFFFQPGAGPVLDVGPYYVANLINLLGPVRRVAAMSNAASETRIIETPGPRKGEAIPVATPTNIQALLEFRSGSTVTLGASWDVWAHRHGPMELYGTEGTLFVPDPNFFGGTVEMAGRDGEISEVAAWDHPFGVLNHTEPSGARLANYRAAGLADMAVAIADGRPARCGLEHALHALDVMTSILRSGETGAFVTLETTCDRPEALGPDAARALLAK